MKIRFLGAVGEVTGSCTWCILDNGLEFLVDCGMFQGWSANLNHTPFPFDPYRISFVLLTHAHADHCGRIPLLYKHGFKGKIICTQATKDLTMLNLNDSAKIQSEKECLYEKHDVKKVLFDTINEHEYGFSPKVDNPIGQDIWVNFTRSSHMLGAASITLTWGVDRKNIFFSGDVGNNREDCCYQPLMKRNYVPLEGINYAVLESTYGEKPPKEDKYKDAYLRIKELKEIICDSAYKLVILPCFAMQRTQDVLFDIFCLLENCNHGDNTCYRIILDSPMAKQACKIFKYHLTRLNNDRNIYLNNKCAKQISEYYKCDISERDIVNNAFGDNYKSAKFTVNFEKEFKCSEYLYKDNPNEKTILLTSSGMCQEGKIKHHLTALKDERVALVLTGYQSTHNGKLLQECAEPEKHLDSNEELEANPKKFPIKDIKGKVFNLGAYYSGHADSDNILRFLFEPSGEPRKHPLTDVTVFLNHGDDKAREKMKEKIEARTPKEDDMRTVKTVIIPQPNEGFYDLNKNEWVKEPHEIIIENQQQIIKRLDSLLEILSNKGQ